MMNNIELLEYLIETAQEQINSLSDSEFNKGAKLAYRGRITVYKNLLLEILKNEISKR